jgi:hypothetical protein
MNVTTVTTDHAKQNEGTQHDELHACKMLVVFFQVAVFIAFGSFLFLPTSREEWPSPHAPLEILIRQSVFKILLSLAIGSQ